jgi:alginate O-acetyltransferase complex protein AlgI
MVGFGSGDGISYHVWLYLQPDVALALTIGAIGATPYLALLGRRILERGGQMYRGERKTLPYVIGGATVAALYVVFAVSVVSIAGGSYNPFIYFRF